MAPDPCDVGFDRLDVRLDLLHRIVRDEFDGGELLPAHEGQDRGRAEEHDGDDEARQPRRHSEGDEPEGDRHEEEGETEESEKESTRKEGRSAAQLRDGILDLQLEEGDLTPEQRGKISAEILDDL